MISPNGWRAGPSAGRAVVLVPNGWQAGVTPDGRS